MSVSPVAAAVVFIFNTAAIRGQPELVHATKLADKCADIHVRFRIGAAPNSRGKTILPKEISHMEASGFRYYITAGASDYTYKHLFWNPETICNYLKEPHAAGIYLHEILSATIGTGHRFNKADWKLLGDYARCASQRHQSIIWNEWAGGNWGWSTFLNQVSRPGSPGNEVLTKYRHTFVFLWADNRDLRQRSQQADMMRAREIVRSLGNPRNPSVPRSLTNPIRYTFRHGVSLQDWLWFEMHRNAHGQIASSAGKTMPPSIISKYGIAAYNHGARYFEFETYWNNPRMFSGIVQLREYIVHAKGCRETPTA